MIKLYSQDVFLLDLIKENLRTRSRSQRVMTRRITRTFPDATEHMPITKALMIATVQT